jgi:hypothetical protein
MVGAEYGGTPDISIRGINLIMSVDSPDIGFDSGLLETH